MDIHTTSGECSKKRCVELGGLVLHEYYVVPNPSPR